MRKVGIIGMGFAGKAHFEAMQTSNQFGVTALCDIDLQKLDKYPSNILSFPSAIDIIKHSEVDVVIIATPHNTHRELVALAKQNNKKVLLEKPLAHTLHDAQSIIDIDRKWPQSISVNMTHRFRDPILLAKRLISENPIGPIEAIEDCCVYKISTDMLPPHFWSVETAGGGVDYTNFIHTADRILFILGEGQQRTGESLNYDYESGVTDNKHHRCNVNDSAIIYAGITGAISQIKVKFELQWLNKNSNRNPKDFIKIIGESGQININVLSGEVTVTRCGKDAVYNTYPDSKPNEDNFIRALKKVHNAFHQMLEGDAHLIPSPRELEKIHEFMESHLKLSTRHRKQSIAAQIRDYSSQHPLQLFCSVAAVGCAGYIAWRALAKSDLTA